MADPGVINEILVIDYVTDYMSLSDDDKKLVQSGVAGAHFLNNCPYGTIIGIPIEKKSSQQKKVYYPLFSHINLPIKPGERAWAFDQKSGLVSYWITRKVQNLSAEDPNFTQDDRALLYAGLSGEDQRALKSTSILFDAKISGAILSSVRSNAVAKDEIIGEPVAKIKSKAPDLTIEGSNDTAIILGHQSATGTGTIDIVAGLGTTSIQATTVNSDGYKEIVKPFETFDAITSLAGTLDPSDSSRITISKYFNADDYYGITGDDSGSQKTIALKTDGIRIVAKNDLKIVVGESDDPSSIILKSNGDIVITPSSAGIIRLGGEDANGAILTQKVNVSDLAGSVIATTPIGTVSGDTLGDGLQGSFATKVLIK